MERAIVVKGRLTGPRSIELEEAVSQATPEVEVLIRPATAASGNQVERVSDFVRRLPAGARSKADIDRQIQAERDSWGDR